MKKLAVMAILLLPSIAFGAGFAKSPLFLSHTPVVEGQSVHLYAVVSNTDTASFSGMVVFYDGSSKIGSVSETLAAGASVTASVMWSPVAGVHSVKADIVSKDATIAEEITETFTIDPKPAPKSATSSIAAQYAAATIDSSAGIQQNIANLSPQVASTTEPAFGFIDGLRNSAADTLDSQIASTKAKVATAPKPGIVAGAATEDVQVQNPTTGFWYWLYTVYLWFLLALRWLIGNAGIFYPVLAILFLYILWRLYRRFRRPY